MVISFDLDDTLICYQPGVPYEPDSVPFYLKYWIKEPLRLGTVSLLQQLQNIGCEVGVYTTSYRSQSYIRSLFKCYGIRLSFVINQQKHSKTFAGKLHQVPSKYPSSFGIHLHIDDSEGLMIEGQRFGFHVLQLDPYDSSWTQKVEEKVRHMRKIIC